MEKTKRTHVCKVCNYNTPFTTNMRTHLSRTVHPCGYITDPVFKEMYDTYVKKEKKEKEFKCDQCHKTFKCQNSVYRHKRLYCNSKNANEIELLRARIEELERNQQQQSQQLVIASNNTSVAGNNNQTNCNNVVINVFGQEALDHLTDEMKDAYIQRRKYGHIQLIQNIQSRKENRNIQLCDSPNRFKVWDGERFKIMMNNDVCERLIDQSHEVLAQHYNENEERFRNTLSESMRDQILEYLDQVLDRELDNWVWLCENVKHIITKINKVPAIRNPGMLS